MADNRRLQDALQVSGKDIVTLRLALAQMATERKAEQEMFDAGVVSELEDESTWRDSLSGMHLDAEAVREARREEVVLSGGFPSTRKQHWRNVGSRREHHRS